MVNQNETARSLDFLNALPESITFIQTSNLRLSRRFLIKKWLLSFIIPNCKILLKRLIFEEIIQRFIME